MVIQPQLCFLLVSNEMHLRGPGLESLAVQALITFSPGTSDHLSNTAS